MEIGSQATNFEHRSFGEELALCQRYYEKIIKATGVSYSTSSINFDIIFKNTKRADPSNSLIDDSVVTDSAGVGAKTSSGSSIVGSDVEVDGASARIDGFSSLTAQRAYPTFGQNTAWIAYDAEL